MKPKTKIQHLFRTDSHALIGQIVTICGWVRTVRQQKTFAFIELSDGSTQRTLQVILDYATLDNPDHLKTLTTGASIMVTGNIVESPGSKQPFELKGTQFTLFGSCPPDYPLQKKRHSFEFLRSIAHLRPRTNTQGAVARVRSRLAFATHQFFQDRGFIYLQSPIITSSDCEGAGKLFQVTTLNLEHSPKTERQGIDYSRDFFSKRAYLAVSGQLNGEAYASAFSDIYTFGPTFRAENSHTSRHLAEFWMIEPEMAFAELIDIATIAEAYLKFLIQDILNHCQDELSFFNQWIEKGLIERLQSVHQTPFEYMTYTQAIATLKQSSQPFEYPVEWGCDLQAEHERYLTEKHCKSPVILTDYPRDIKAFYMRDNDDGKTAAALDVLVPRIGEIIGGSQREERYDRLKQKIIDHGLDPDLYAWYLDLRRFGTVPHGGFGLGFERLVQFATGIENIRDAVAFPRTPGNCAF
ncbi:MAG: asparagine--tRNA ligase [Chlamydiota bacterium]